MEHRIDHAAEAIRLIDQTLMEEGVVLDSLRLLVEQNAVEADAVSAWDQTVATHKKV